jgi:hypothetical protein
VCARCVCDARVDVFCVFLALVCVRVCECVFAFICLCVCLNECWCVCSYLFGSASMSGLIFVFVCL